ncbi:MAG: serine/threonine protein kinase [Vicinamibacteria bacterium]|nr:serine/threonine protein kinase [Vicinamibacteria bacterium]
MTLSLNPGARLGPYEIVGPLGAGGMGEVYDAKDTRLDRGVAIKILRPEFADAPDRRARFEREARAIASLNHPHICTLHDIGHHDDIAFLVMERLEGETLADRLVRGPLPFAEALVCAGQIADALDRAHGQGIVHRDLKPANIMLTRSGVKLLDFGLAQLLAPDAPVADGLTRAGTLTQEGVIVGTLQYMAPEQLEGKPTDARSDLFAFGAILYEMVTGRRAFDAPSQAGLVGAILHAEVPQVTSAPPAFARVLAACLAKRPEDRWSSAHDVRLLLNGIGAETQSGIAAVPPHATPRRDRWGWVAAVLALAALALVVARSRSHLAVPALAIVASRAPVGRHRRCDAAVLVAGQPAPRFLRAQRVEDGGRVGRDAADPCGRTRAPGWHLEQRRRDRVCAVSERPGPADTRNWRDGHAGEGAGPRAAPAMVPLVSPGWTSLPVPGRRSHLQAGNGGARRLARLHRDARTGAIHGQRHLRRARLPAVPSRRRACWAAIRRRDVAVGRYAHSRGRQRRLRSGDLPGFRLGQHRSARL